MIISGTNFYNGTITASGVVTMRSLLSASGQTAYDSASTGNFFNVSAADYASVATGLVSVTKYVMTDVQISASSGGWTATYAQAYPTGVATVPAGEYIIGFVCKPYSTAGTATPLISTTFPPTGASYTAIANSPTQPTASALNYYIRKAPTTATASTSYLGLVLSVTGALVNIGGSGYYSVGGPPYTSFTAWTPTFMTYQVLGTPTVQW